MKEVGIWKESSGTALIWLYAGSEQVQKAGVLVDAGYRIKYRGQVGLFMAFQRILSRMKISSEYTVAKWLAPRLGSQKSHFSLLPTQQNELCL